MTPEQAIEQAQSVVADYTTKFPRAKSIMFNRLNVRQRELFTVVRSWDREYYGASLVGTLAGGALDLSQAQMEAQGVYPIESLEHVQIEAAGVSSYSSGDKVHVVPTDDVHGHLPPRMSFRSFVLRQIETDLANVVSLKVFYARRPKLIDSAGKVAGNADRDLEIVEPYDFLLVWDLAKDLIRRTVDIDTEKKSAAVVMIEEEESRLLMAFEEHVRGAAFAREDRFA